MATHTKLARRLRGAAFTLEATAKALQEERISFSALYGQIDFTVNALRQLVVDPDQTSRPPLGETRDSLDTVNIEISGCTLAGKSTLLDIIGHQLQQLGFQVECWDEEQFPDDGEKRVEPDPRTAEMLTEHKSHRNPVVIRTRTA